MRFQNMMPNVIIRYNLLFVLTVNWWEIVFLIKRPSYSRYLRLPLWQFSPPVHGWRHEQGSSICTCTMAAVGARAVIRQWMADLDFARATHTVFISNQATHNVKITPESHITLTAGWSVVKRVYYWWEMLQFSVLAIWFTFCNIIITDRWKCHFICFSEMPSKPGAMVIPTQKPDVESFVKSLYQLNMKLNHNNSLNWVFNHTAYTHRKKLSVHNEWHFL